MNGKFEAPKGYRLMREETPLTLGLLAVLQHFTARGWHGDNVTAMGMRVRCLIETLTDMDWIAINLFKVTDDHETFEFDQRLLQAGAAATMRYDPDTQAFLLEREQFKDRLLYLLTHNL